MSAIDAIIALLALRKEARFGDVANVVRTFVNDHSQHKIDAGFYADWPRPYILT